jgi:hypothetical protein
MPSENQESPGGEQQAANQTPETPAKIVDAPTELKPPPPNAKCRNTCKPKKHWLDYVTFGMEFLGLVVVCIYAGYTIKIYCASRDSADAARDAATAATGAAETAREALVVGQRAYVVDSFDEKQEGNFFKISVRWENRGETSTKFMTMHMSQSGIRRSPLPKNFAFPNTWEDGKDHGGINVVVTAKGTLPGMEMRRPIADIKNTPNFIYVWGWATYNDVFTNTPQHVIRFCEEWNIKSGGTYIHTLETRDSCYRHNCVDEECKP